MKLTFTAVALSFSVADEAGNIIAAHSAENVESTLDVRALLNNVSSLAHLFKQLDATHEPLRATREMPVADAPITDAATPELLALVDKARALCNIIATDGLADTVLLRKDIGDVRRACQAVDNNTGARYDQRRNLLDACSHLTRDVNCRFTGNEKFDAAYRELCDARTLLRRVA